jgi:hypothetical protein
MFDFRRVLENISTYAILIPIIAGFITYRFSSRGIKFLLFFLIWGFVVDVPRNYIENKEFNVWAYNFYSLTEIIFMLWFLLKHSSGILLIKFIKGLLPVMFLFWVTCIFLLQPHNSEIDYSALFDSTSAFIISFIAAFSLLEITKHSESLVILPAFWFLTGIFFYFFCANFIFGFLQTDFLNQIWFLHNIINIITYLIYTKAFLTIGKPAQQ